MFELGVYVNVYLEHLFLIFYRFRNLPSVLYLLKTLEIVLASGNQVREWGNII